MSAPGRLYGVGVGPGDPELVTVKAQRIIGACDVVAYPEKRLGSSIARQAAAPWIAAGCEELALVYPVTTGDTDHPDGYEGALRDYYDDGAAQVAALLDGGRDVAVLCEGDPFFYGSYMYLHERLADRYATQVVPGVTAFSAAAAAAGTPLAKRDDVLVVAPGTLPADVLAAHLRSADAAVVMKLGRRFDGVLGAAALAGVAERGVYVERASCEHERVAALDEVDGDVPYLSLVLVPTARAAPAPAQRADAADRGSLAVVGLGPAGPAWLTPEASATLAAADELVGDRPELDR
ncbi:MAG: precorrin-2 C20-methyltransferase / precorrin-3B C17-methyltransferase, partial [Solirubrobacteraceae bacterium]|nr:precorrin-2 C20-methyltransferase / precorrin-3B C17-methyltransferase [Solirubrobacteraceae bacterium]